nr:hypothetical transcript [Hymenolepis microstoma]
MDVLTMPIMDNFPAKQIRRTSGELVLAFLRAWEDTRSSMQKVMSHLYNVVSSDTKYYNYPSTKTQPKSDAMSSY